MNPLSPSLKTVLRVIGKEGAMTHKDIVKKTRCSPRTVRYALKKLRERDLLLAKMNTRDMRQIIYENRHGPSEAGADNRRQGTFEDPWHPSSPIR